MSENRKRHGSEGMQKEEHRQGIKQINRPEQIHGGNIYSHEGVLDFSANINPFGISESVREAAIKGIYEADHYPDPICGKLRKALSEKLNLSPDLFAFGNGAADLIFSVVLAEKPRKAVLTAPCFSEYAQALKAVGCEIDYYYLCREHDFRLDEDYLEKLTEDVNLIFLCSPDNPSGQVIARDLFEKILRKCEMYGIRVLLDECFYEFLDPGERTCKISCIQKCPLLVLLRAFTKMHGIPGLRLGYLICADRAFLGRLSSVRQPWSVSAAASYAGTAALAEDERVERTRQYVAGERLFLERELEKLNIFYVPSKANYILFYSPHDLYALLLKKKILIRDCRDYEGLEPGYYRIAVRTREENRKLIDALREICKK